MNERPDANDEAVDTKERTTTRGSVDVRDDTEGFLPDQQMDEYREEWTDIQTAFVDDPRTAVKRAHGLVTDIVTELNDTLARERSGLESAWNRGEDADTENLRVALTRYRAFFNRLLR